MADSPHWMIWPDNVALSVLVVFFIALPFLYAARKPAHDLLRSLGRLADGPLRLSARWLLAAAAEMQERNKSVLLAHGREEVGQHIAREFERVAALVKRDLEGYPALQRKLLDEITRVEEDYRKCGEVPPPAPDWVEALSAIVKIKSNGNEMLQRILEQISGSVNEIHEKALAEYRRAYETRHKILDGFMPFWRSLGANLTQADRKMTSLHERAAAIDAQMERFEQIVARTDKAEHALTLSALTQFVVATLVMVIAAGGALINFKLIALPMSEMVGAGDYLTNTLRTSEVAALVIIFVEATMGLFLMETLRITHLFPRISNLNERTRKRMMWTAFVLLVTLAGIEAALALMRDMLIADKQALLHSLAATQQAATDGWVSHIPTAGQMLLGFILPFALAFIAIPLESFMASARAVGGAALVIIVRATALVLRAAGNLLRQASRALIIAYDVVIGVPLLIERWVQASRSGSTDDAPRAVRPVLEAGEQS
jgi:hypothetical protein